MKRNLILSMVALVIACGTGLVGSRAQSNQKSLTLFLGYIPNVQFAPVYVALERGYFATQGLNVTLEHSYNETDGLTRIGVNQLQFGVISGEQVLLARAKGAPAVYVFRWYQRFPVGIASPIDANITDPKQLAGHIVSVPAKYGASYIGFEALLHAVGLKDSDMKDVREIGFNTVPILCARQVDASVIYVANEPVQIENQCFKVNVIRIADYANLVANGLVTNETTIQAHPDWVRAMNAALAKGIADTIADPNAAYAIAQKYVQGLGDDPVQRQVLLNSIDLWKSDTPGYSDPAAWKLTQDTLLAMGLIDQPLDLTKVFSNDFIPSLPTATPSATALATMAATAAQ
ncbi:MAG: ABC transporter substrate-binding protein [Aggregatilineales bacterium]